MNLPNVRHHNHRSNQVVHLRLIRHNPVLNQVQNQPLNRLIHQLVILPTNPHDILRHCLLRYLVGRYVIPNSMPFSYSAPLPTLLSPILLYPTLQVSSPLLLPYQFMNPSIIKHSIMQSIHQTTFFFFLPTKSFINSLLPNHHINLLRVPVANLLPNPRDDPAGTLLLSLNLRTYLKHSSLPPSFHPSFSADNRHRNHRVNPRVNLRVDRHFHLQKNLLVCPRMYPLMNLPGN